MIQRAVDRIRQMEHDYDVLQDIARDNPAVLREDVSVRAILQNQMQYYESGQWLQDYKLDEQGLLPQNLKRGVLAQDTLYDFFDRIQSTESIRSQSEETEK